MINADSRFAPSEWETSLQSNTGASLESALVMLAICSLLSVYILSVIAKVILCGPHKSDMNLICRISSLIHLLMRRTVRWLSARLQHLQCVTRFCGICFHYCDIIMGATQITSRLTIVYPTVCSGADQGKHQSSASLAFVWRIHRWQVMLRMLPLDDVIIITAVSS